MVARDPWTDKTVLIVDDSPLMGEELAQIFRQLGMDVRGCARNGIEAIDKYARLNPDLVSLDIVMPEMNGIDCYRQILALYPEARMIFVSCLGSEHIIGENFKDEIPLWHFVAKPVEPAALRRSLNEAFHPTAVDPPLAPPAPTPSKTPPSAAPVEAPSSLPRRGAG